MIPILCKAGVASYIQYVTMYICKESTWLAAFCYFQCDDQKVTEEIRKQAKQIVEKCGFKDYRETSTKHGFEVDAVFEAITSLVMTTCISVYMESYYITIKPTNYDYNDMHAVTIVLSL